MTTAAVVLAAGEGARFAGADHKLTADLGGKPLVRWAVEAATASGFDETIVVTGAVDLSGVVPDDATIVRNESWERGQSSSLLVAVEHARTAGHEAIVVGLGDQPFVGIRPWMEVRRHDHSPIVTANFAGQRRPPVRLDRAVWDLISGDGDAGARWIMRDHPELVHDVPCLGDPSDIDTEEALRNMTELLDTDVQAVTELLGRSPQGAFEVVVRNPAGAPVVLRNFPILDDGTPMPTLYWLCGERENTMVGRLESLGGVRRAEAELGLEIINAAHDRYRVERDSLLDASGRQPTHRPSGGVGGTRNGVKCLHAHYGWWLAGGDDPVGQWVADHLEEVDHSEWPSPRSVQATEDPEGEHHE